ncbi:antirestriction protein ArdA [Porticoccus sp. GXU_MW_L64]
MTGIKIYVADLAAYNNGCLHGCWIDATLELDEIQDQINTMLASSPEEGAEEYAIHDYEGFGSYRLSEYEGVDSAHEVACFIEEHDELGAELLAYYSDIEEARKAIEESYCGCHTSVADYAQELTEQTGDIPSHLEMYIDYERMGRDMELSGDIFTIEAGYQEVHIFWSA